MTPAYRSLLAVLATALLAPVAPAAATTVYRCGADGRSFQAVPCAEGAPAALKIDRPDAERQAEAAAEHRRMTAVGRELEHERRARERIARPMGATGITAQPLASWQRDPGVASAAAARGDTGSRRHKTRAAQRRGTTEDFVAIDPTTIKSPKTRER